MCIHIYAHSTYTRCMYVWFSCRRCLLIRDHNTTYNIYDMIHESHEYIHIYIYIHVFDHRPCAARRRHCFFFFKGRSAPVLVVKTVIFSSLCLFFDLVAIVRLRLDVTLSNPIQPVLARKMKQAKSEVTISLLGTYTPGTFFTSWHAKNPCFLVS